MAVEGGGGEGGQALAAAAALGQGPELGHGLGGELVGPQAISADEHHRRRRLEEGAEGKGEEGPEAHPQRVSSNLDP